METETASTARAVLPGLPMDPAEWECASSLLQLAQVKLCKCQRDLHISSRHKGTHTAAVFHGGDCSVSMGWGRQGNFQLKIRWIGHSEQLHVKKYLLLQLLLVHFFVVAIESQHFCRYLHSKTSDWICVFKLTRHTCLCCSKNHHLPSPDNLLYFLFWPSDYGRFLVCF